MCLEASAKKRINVDESFFELVRAIRRFNKVSRRLLAGGYELLTRSLQSAGNGAAPATAGSSGPIGNGIGSTPAKRQDEQHGGGCCGGCVVL